MCLTSNGDRCPSSLTPPPLDDLAETVVSLVNTIRQETTYLLRRMSIWMTLVANYFRD